MRRFALALLLIPLAVFAWAAAPPTPGLTLRYVRPSKDRFVLESRVTEVTTREGMTYTSLTDRGSEKMTLTIRFADNHRVRDAEAMQQTTKGKQTVAVVFKDNEAILMRQGKTERLKVPADVVVTTAPDWSDIFWVIRRYDQARGGKQSFAGLWIHPVQPVRQLSFTVAPEQEDVPFTYADGRAEATLSNHRGHAMIVFE